MTNIGHNSEPVEAFAKEQLRSIIERVEAVELEIKERQSDRSDIYKEADGNGFDVPALKAIIRARREDPEKRQAREAMIEIYLESVGLS